MAHECPKCSGECYCCGDIDDCVLSHTPAKCKGCDACLDEERDQEQDAWEPEPDDDDDDQEGFNLMEWGVTT